MPMTPPPFAAPEHPPNAGGNPFRPDYLSSGATEESQIQIRQFGIIHLFAWITVTAILLKINQAIGLLNGEEYGRFVPAFVALYLIFYAAGIVGTCVLVRTHGLTSEVLMRLQPGHRLVLLNIFLGISYCPFMINQSEIIRSQGNGSLAMIFSLILLGVFVIFGIVAVIQLQDGKSWKFLLAFFVAYHLLCIASFFLAPCCFLTLLAAVVNDWRCHRPRDWLHWLGVGMLCVDAMLWSIPFFL
jgi:hypothetical protein